MSFRTTTKVFFTALFSAITALMLLSGCGQGPGDAQVGVYEDPPELTATYDSLEALAGNTGKTLGYEDYRAVYQHFLEKYPNSTELHRDWQSAMDAFDRSEEKIATYRELHEENPGSALYAYLYGRCLSDAEEREMFQQAIELDPDYFWGHFGYAVVNMRTAPVDTATTIEHLEKARKIDPTYPGIYTIYINLHDSRGQLQEALKAANQYATVSPDSYRPVMIQTDLLKRMDRDEEALEVMLEYADENEKSTGVRADLMGHYKEAGNYSEALKWQYDYVEIARDPEAALVDVAKLHLALDQADSASHYLQQAAERGYADFRRVASNPELAGVREAEGYDELMKTLKENAKEKRELRLAKFLENAEENRAKALENKIDEPAPTFAFENLEGETVALEDLRGKVVVIDFWATWCGPCRMTMPILQEFVDQAPEDVEFLSLNVWEDDKSGVEPYIEDYGYTFNVLLGDNQIASDYGVTGIPTMVVIGPEGNLQYRHVGYDPHLDQILLWQTTHLLKNADGAQVKL